MSKETKFQSFTINLYLKEDLTEVVNVNPFEYYRTFYTALFRLLGSEELVNLDRFGAWATAYEGAEERKNRIFLFEIKTNQPLEVSVVRQHALQGVQITLSELKIENEPFEVVVTPTTLTS